MDKLRHLLITAAVAATLLIAMPPAEAKSIWLKCGKQEINLDSEKERFSLVLNEEVYQGRAMFSPGQIDFEFKWYTRDNGGLKYAYSIDRKSLNYTRTTLNSMLGSPWTPQEGSGNPNPTFGKCSIMKNPPTAGNKI